jgi:hypothetical protein
MSAVKLRAAGGIRISELAGRGKEGGKRLRSDDDQLGKLKADCDRLGFALDYHFEEMDTSGALPLAQRPKLMDAIERVERGEINAIVFPYRDRSDRSIEVMTEVVRRIDAVPGAVLIAGGSVLTHKTADGWARSVLESFANEMPSRLAREKVRSAHVEAVADGIPPYAAVPGYAKGADGRFVVVEELVPVIREAFAMRDRSVSINTIRRYLADYGIKRSYAGVESLLRSETYLGNIKFGDLRNDGCFPAIIDSDVWHRVQGKRGTRGRQAKSDRLLARQKVLVCGTCGARMTATSSNGHAFYRCQHNASPDCPARATVSAERVEALVVAKLKARRELARLAPVASADLGEQYHQAARDAKAALETTINMLDGLSDLGSAQRKIAALKERWQTAEREAEAYGRTEGARSAMRKLDDWDRLPLDIQRGIIRATIERVVVAPVGGLGLSGAQWDERRITVQFFD